MKTFCSAQEIEELAARGGRELFIDDNTILTDLARHAADQLGIKIIHKSQASSPAAPAAAPVAASLARPNPIRPGSKPKGCQHGPVTGLASRTAPTVNQASPAGSAGPAATSGNVVDQLVGLVKRLGNTKGGAS